MCDKRFSTDDELMYAIEWLKEQSELFSYFAGIKMLQDRYKLPIDKGSDYAEKQIYAHPSLLFK